MKRYHITDVPFSIALIIIVLVIIPIGCIHSYKTYANLLKKIHSIESNYILQVKKEIKRRLDNVLKMTEHSGSQIEKKAKSGVKAQVDTLYTMLNGIYRKNPSIVNHKEKQVLIKEILRDIRFRDKTGYYFAFTPEGIDELYPPDPGLEGKNLINLKDSKGRFIVRDMIHITATEKSGFYKYAWPKPEDQKKPLPKMVYVRMFEPFNWVIGTGTYLDDVKQIVQTSVIEAISNLYLPKGEALFVLDRSGKTIAGEVPLFLKNRTGNTLDSLFENSEGDSERYVWFPDPGQGGQVSQFLIHSQHFESWDWTYFIVLSNERFNQGISIEKSNLEKEIRQTLTVTAIIILLTSAVILFLGGHFKNQVKKGIDTFFRFFIKASTTYEHIDVESLKFNEFVRIAEYANKMVDERLKKEKTIKKFTKQLQQANKKLANIASTDGLTGVANRRRFDEVLKKEWARATRNDRIISLCMIDIDFFKVYNDRYGHQMGDECLRQFASALKIAIKRPADLLARYGGEEFVALLPGTDIEGATILAKQMQKNVEKLNMEHKGSRASDRVSFSMGIAALEPECGTQPDILVEQADKALYLAKSEGRNRYVVSP